MFQVTLLHPVPKLNLVWRTELHLTVYNQHQFVCLLATFMMYNKSESCDERLSDISDCFIRTMGGGRGDL